MIAGWCGPFGTRSGLSDCICATRSAIRRSVLGRLAPAEPWESGLSARLGCRRPLAGDPANRQSRPGAVVGGQLQSSSEIRGRSDLSAAELDPYPVGPDQVSQRRLAALRVSNITARSPQRMPGARASTCPRWAATCPSAGCCRGRCRTGCPSCSGRWSVCCSSSVPRPGYEGRTTPARDTARVFVCGCPLGARAGGTRPTRSMRKLLQRGAPMAARRL